MSFFSNKLCKYVYIIVINQYTIATAKNVSKYLYEAADNNLLLANISVTPNVNTSDVSLINPIKILPDAGMALRPIAVLTGLHHAMTPIALQNFANQGYDMLMPMMFMANMAIAGTTLAMYRKTKSSKEKSIIVSSAISAFLGITEPALFGVITKYKRALVAVTLGSAIASAFISFFGVRIYGYILSSIFSLPAYIGKYFIFAIIGIVIAIAVAYFSGMLMVKRSPELEKDKKVTE